MVRSNLRKIQEFLIFNLLTIWNGAEYFYYEIGFQFAHNMKLVFKKIIQIGFLNC